MAIPHVATSPKCHSMMRGVLRPLIGLEIDNLRIPINVAREFEPSQFGTIVGTLVDALLPSIALKLGLGLEKAEGILGDREGYPDFINSLGYRIELKGLFKDNLLLDLKRPPTRREASARLTQKVTRKNVITETDLLLLLCYQMEPYSKDASVVVPKIIDLELFSVSELIEARDYRMENAGGKWFGDYETPTIPSRKGIEKINQGIPTNDQNYGRKESEGYDFNEDTNFGKMKRIPHKNLQLFLKKHGCSYSAKGDYPSAWRI